MRVGITGHRSLTGDGAWAWAAEQLKATLEAMPSPIIGVTSLAVGSDQMFAEAVLKLGGRIEVVIPFEGYPETFDSHGRSNFYRLCQMCSRTQVLAPRNSKEESYLAAGREVVDSSDLLVAIWDGQPARGLGGTGDVVDYAVGKKKPVIHINPVQRTLTRVL
jgi:hypothetical protein